VVEADAPRYTIVAVSDAFLRATQSRRERLLGRGLVEALWENPEHRLARERDRIALLDRVRTLRVPDALPVLRHDVPRPPEQGGGLEERWWRPSAVPVLGEGGEVRYIIHAVEDVTARRAADEAEARVRRSEAQLEAIVGTSAEAILVLDRQQRVTLYNHGAQLMFGWTQEELLGQPHDLLLPERHRDLHRDLIARFAQGPDQARLKAGGRSGIRGLRKNGEEFAAEASISKVTVDGEVLLSVSLRDVSVRIAQEARLRRRAEEARFLARVGAVLGAALLDFEGMLARLTELPVPFLGDFCGVNLLDEGGAWRLRVHHADPALADVAEALGRYPLRPEHAGLGGPVLATHAPVLTNEVSSDALASIAEDAEHLALLRRLDPSTSISVPLVARGRLLGVMVVGACGGSRAYDDDDLHLALDLGARAALALDNARLYDEARQAVQARDDVMGIVAHDLRNPLGGILMATSRLRSPARRGREVESATLEHIAHAAERMDRIIEDLLEISRMHAGQPIRCALGRLALEDVLEEAVASQVERAAEADIELVLDLRGPLLPVSADRHRVLQVLENLIGNALRFTPRGGRVRLSAAQEDAQVRVEVVDTGPGIPASDLPHVFDRYWQSRRTDRRGGAGLGLTIARGIVAAHGGRIGVESPPGEGARFWFTLPAHVGRVRPSVDTP